MASTVSLDVAWTADPSRTSSAADYERLRATLTRVVARVCSGISADRRDDLVQDCVLRVMDLSRKSEEERRLSSSYLYRVAHSVLIDEIRRVRRRGEVPIDAEDGEPVPLPATRGNPEATAAGKEINRGILDCLARLRQERRLGVTLYLQGHSVVEAAQILDWSVKRVANLVYRGLADLRSCLVRKGITP
jgi:RNA polymerase sigma-70 factor (ECF subfamily)